MKNYTKSEKELPAFPFEFDFDSAYRAEGEPGIAYWVDGYETESDEDTDWSGYEVATGRVVAHMVGDDRRFSFDPDDLTKIGEDDYCPGCGAIPSCYATEEEER